MRADARPTRTQCAPNATWHQARFKSSLPFTDKSAALLRLDTVDKQFRPALRTRLDGVCQCHELDKLHDADRRTGELCVRVGQHFLDLILREFQFRHAQEGVGGALAILRDVGIGLFLRRDERLRQLWILQRELLQGEDHVERDVAQRFRRAEHARDGRILGFLVREWRRGEMRGDLGLVRQQ